MNPVAAVVRASVPEPGQLVRVRNRRWVVADVDRSGQAPDVLARPEETAQNLVTLTSVEDDGLGETLGVIWEVEPGAAVLEGTALPEPHPDHFDSPDRLDAFLDAVRWGAITSAERDLLQAPFRSGIDVEDYQLDPVGPGVDDASDEPADRRRRRAGQDHRGRSRGPGVAAPPPGPHGAGGLPGVAVPPVAGARWARSSGWSSASWTRPM